MSSQHGESVVTSLHDSSFALGSDQRNARDNGTMTHAHDQPSSSIGSSGIDWGSCGSFVVWAFATWWDWTLACLELWWHVLVASNLSEKGLYRLSNLMLGWHYLGVWMAHVWLAQESHQQEGIILVDIHTLAVKIPKPLLLLENEKNNSALNDATWWLWALPLLTGSITALVAIPYLIRIPYSLHQGAVVVTLVVLFFLEAMLPIMLLVCTCLCLFHRLTWVAGALVLAFLWIVISVSTHWIRCLVYQNMGHG